MPSNDSWVFLFQEVMEFQASALALSSEAEAGEGTAWPGYPQLTCRPSPEVKRLEFPSLGIWPRGIKSVIFRTQICICVSIGWAIYIITCFKQFYRLLHGTLLWNMVFFQRFWGCKFQLTTCECVDGLAYRCWHVQSSTQKCGCPGFQHLPATGTW